MKFKWFLMSTVLVLGVLYGNAQEVKENLKSANVHSETSVKAQESLVVLWTSGDPEVAEKMVFMYTYNAMKNDWWEDITFIVWGPSSKLLSENEELQKYIVKMMDVGVHVEACKACADMYGVSDKLSKLGIDVRYLGKPLTGYMKSGRHVLTF